MRFRHLARRIPGTWKLFARQADGTEIVVWATEALEAGFDSPSLRMVAAARTPTSWFAVESDFRNALRELGVERYPTEEDALRFHGAEIAEGLLAGRMDAEAALEEFHRTVVSPLMHPADLQTWCHLAEGYDPSHGQIDDARRKLLAYQVARKYLDERGE
jgi:hypothetical protein